MEQLKRSMAGLSIALCLSAALAGCNGFHAGGRGLPRADATESAFRIDETENLPSARPEVSKTLLWMDGARLPTYLLPEGGLCLQLADVADAAGGGFQTESNTGVLSVWGRELRFREGSAAVEGAEETLLLSAPVLSCGGVWYAPAGELLSALGLTELIDPEQDQRWYTHIVKHDAVPTGYRIPILMYHAVSDDLWGEPELFVSPAALEEEIQALLDAGYTPITFEDLDHIQEIEKPVILTFDDGYDDNYTELFPILQKYKVKATVFVIVNDIGKKHKLTAEQIREMSDSGLVSIQSHTMSHNFLSEMNEAQLRSEHYDSMLALARITGKQPFVMCYPSGVNTELSSSVTAEYYEYGLIMGGACYVSGSDPYQIPRYYISRFTSLDSFMEKLAG